MPITNILGSRGVSNLLFFMYFTWAYSVIRYVQIKMPWTYIFDGKAQIQWTYWPWDENQKTLCKVLPLFTSVRCLHFRYLLSYCLWVNDHNIWNKSLNPFSVFVSTLTIVAIALDRCNQWRFICVMQKMKSRSSS